MQSPTRLRCRLVHYEVEAAPGIGNVVVAPPCCDISRSRGPFHNSSSLAPPRRWLRWLPRTGGIVIDVRDPSRSQNRRNRH
jgi:hypothetical protein